MASVISSCITFNTNKSQRQQNKASVKTSKGTTEQIWNSYESFTMKLKNRRETLWIMMAVQATGKCVRDEKELTAMCSPMTWSGNPKCYKLVKTSEKEKKLGEITFAFQITKKIVTPIRVLIIDLITSRQLWTTEIFLWQKSFCVFIAMLKDPSKPSC